MKHFHLWAAFCLCLSVVLTGCDPKPKFVTSEIVNPIPLKFGDPYLLHASDGRYYMYGTSLEDGFEAFVSDDLLSWEHCGQVYKGGSEGQWNEDCFWAPEVYERDGRYYMFFSANYRENPTDEVENFKIGVAVSDSPAGPFMDLMDRPVFNPDYPIIDANVYFDDAHGRCYLYFSRCCYKHPVESEIADSLRSVGSFQAIEESWVYGVEMNPERLSTIQNGQLPFLEPGLDEALKRHLGKRFHEGISDGKGGAGGTHPLRRLEPHHERGIRPTA